MSSNNFIVELLAELEYFAKRLRVDIRGIPCDLVLRLANRARKLESELEKYRRIYSEINSKYNEVAARIRDYMVRSSFYVKLFVTLLMILVLITVTIALMVSLPGAPLSFLLPYLSLVITVPVGFIVFIVLAFIYFYGKLRAEYKIKQLTNEKEKLEKKLNYYKKKIEDKQIEIEDTRASYLEKEHSLCKCHDEFLEAKNLLTDLHNTLREIGNILKNSRGELKSKIYLAKEILDQLSKYSSVCNYIHTEDYSMKIEIHPDMYRSLSTIYVEGGLSDPEGYILVEFRGKRYRISLDDYIEAK